MSKSPKLKIEMLPVDALREYEGNARQHGETDVAAIKASIEQFGFNDPIGIWGENIIVEGHGRLMAAKDLGMTEVPCIRLDHLSEEERRAYALAHNKTAELSAWKFETLNAELAGIREIDMEALGFRRPSGGAAEDWFENRERDDDGYQEGNDEYNEFLDKFKQPKTTDDCYTPDIVYDAVKEWVEDRYGPAEYVRPFYPGGDYQKFKYPEGCIVLDNPPFSILIQIRRWYQEHGIKYFLFAPSVSCLNTIDCAVGVGVSIIYENKANVNTSFVTNMEDAICITAPELYRKVKAAADKYAKRLTRSIPKFEYPNELITSSKLAYLSKYGQELVIPRGVYVRELDAQKGADKTIFGGGFLISEKAAAEKWELSDRERAIVKALDDEP